MTCRWSCIASSQSIVLGGCRGTPPAYLWYTVITVLRPARYLHPEVLLAALWQVAQNRVHRSAGAAVEHVEVSAQPLRAVQIKRVRHNVLRKPRLLEPSFRSVLRDQTHESIQSIVGTVDR